MDTKQFKKMKRFRGMIRFMGAIFTLVGIVLLFFFVPILLDPNATLLYNGEPTSEFGPKLSATLFVGSFVVIGLIALFCSSRYLDKLFVWRLSLLSTIFSKGK